MADRPVGINGDPILRLQSRIEALEAQNRSLKTATRPTFPVYPPETVDSLLEDFNDGEFWINSNDGFLYYFYNGQIHRTTST